MWDARYVFVFMSHLHEEHGTSIILRVLDKDNVSRPLDVEGAEEVFVAPLFLVIQLRFLAIQLLDARNRERWEIDDFDVKHLSFVEREPTNLNHCSSLSNL
jgi:hypothetical protein